VLIKSPAPYHGAVPFTQYSGNKKFLQRFAIFIEVKTSLEKEREVFAELRSYSLRGKNN